MKSQQITSIQGLVAAFDGPPSMADWAMTSVQNVYNWIARDHIPPSYHMRIALEASCRGLVIAPEVLGLEGDDAERFHAVFCPAA